MDSDRTEDSQKSPEIGSPVTLSNVCLGVEADSECNSSSSWARQGIKKQLICADLHRWLQIFDRNPKNLAASTNKRKKALFVCSKDGSSSVCVRERENVMIYRGR